MHGLKITAILLPQLSLVLGFEIRPTMPSFVVLIKVFLHIITHLSIHLYTFLHAEMTENSQCGGHTSEVPELFVIVKQKKPSLISWQRIPTDSLQQEGT